jgi:hypothetical protein
MTSVARQSKENLVLFPILGFLGLSVFMLFQNLEQKSFLDTSQLTPIGATVHAEKSVNRRYVGDPFWLPLEGNSQVYQKDTIQTGSDSTIQIRFDDGSTMDLGENSLVVLDRSQSRFLVDVVQGQVSTKRSTTGSKLSLKTGDTAIDAEGDVDLNVGQDGQAQINVTRGTAEIQSGAEKVRLSENQVGEITKDKKLTVKDLPFRRIQPLSQMIPMQKGEAVPVQFKWKPLEGIKRVQLQIVRGKTFSKENLSRGYNRSVRANARKIRLQDGLYSWRLIASTPDGQKVTGPTWRLHLQGFEAPEGISPLNKESVTTLNQNHTQTFEWSTPVAGVQYRFELMDENKKVIQSKQEITGQKLTIRNIKPGVYHWRVQADLNNQMKPLSSPTYQFVVDRMVKLPIPKGLSPLEGSELPYLKGRPIGLAWNPVENASAYRVQIAPILEGEVVKNKIETLRTEGSALAWQAPGPGEYLWSVRAFTQSIKPSDPVQARFKLFIEDSINIIEPKEDISKKWYLSQESFSQSFRWIPPKTAVDSLKLLVSPNKNFEGKVNAQELPNSGRARLSFKKAGVYHWKMVGYNEDSKPILGSAPRSIEITRALEKPALKSPKANYQYEGFKKPKITFSWQAVPAAQSYELILIGKNTKRKNQIQRGLAAEDSKGTVFKKILEKNQFTIENVDFDSYRWQVKALHKDGFTSESDPRSLSVKQKRYLPPPTKVFAPEVK